MQNFHSWNGSYVTRVLRLQGNMDPRIFYYSEPEIKNYLESLSDFGKKNHDWVFNLGHGFLPDIDYKKVQNVVNWIKNKNWNR